MAACVASLCLGTSAIAAPAHDRDPRDCADPRWSPGRGALTLLRVPPTVAGDALGGTGLVLAASIATLGDGIALLDRNVVTRGIASTAVHGVAEGVSWLGTTALELLRGQDIERWPEDPATYRLADPFRGRLDTSFSGIAALRVGLTDAVLGPIGGVAQIVGLSGFAARVACARRDERRFYLGPEPLPSPAETAS